MSAATIDLVVYNSFLRIKLLEAFGDDCLVIISPSEGKKNLSGKGNAKKDDMINKNMSPTVGISITVGWTYTPKAFQWGK